MKLKFNLKRYYKKLILLSVLVLFVVSLTGVVKHYSRPKIERILETSSYSYLPKEAKNYIKEVYEKTGDIVLTEKNKEENIPYLNPNYIEYLMLSEEQQKQEGEIPFPFVVDYQNTEVTESEELPKQYNLTNVNEKKYVTPVRDQGDLGLCWAFASAGSVESHLLKTKDISYTSTSQLISERQIDYVTANNGIKDYKSEYVSFIDRDLGDGGNFYISTIAMANGVSLVDYKGFKPYNDKDLEPMELEDVLNYNDSLYEVDDTINMPILEARESTGNLTEEQAKERESYINEIKRNIMEYGAAYVSTYAQAGCTYQDEKLNNLVIDVYNCSKSGAHAMQIIGWDDDAEYSYCADTLLHKADTTNCRNVVNGKGMWILKNSWGDNTPNPYLTYDSLDSQIHFIKRLSTNRRRTWDNNYILGDESSYTNHKEYLLLDTKIKNEEELEKIKFITTSSGGTYNVKIVKKDGSFKEFSQTTDLPGLISFYLSDVVVDKDSKVIISSDDGTYLDKVTFITSDIEETPYISLEKYEGMEISEHTIRLYSDTKGIWSDSEITYKLYDQNNNDVSDGISYQYNTIVENNVNTLMTFLPTLKNGNYRLDAIYDSEVINSINVTYKKMEGEGTEDNPYVITNPVHLDQIREDLDAYYVLGNDIDLTNETREGGRFYNEAPWGLGGHGWEPIIDFSGTLDGQGHTIKGLYQANYLRTEDIGYSRRYNVGGLFGSAVGNVSIKNIILEDFDINCHGDCGTLLGNLELGFTEEYNANFSNIAVKNSNMNFDGDNNKSSNIGGVFGNISGNSKSKLNIINIYSEVNIGNFGLFDVGGLVSHLSSFKEINIKNIQLVGNLKGRYDDGSNAGVLAYQISSYKINIENVLSTIYDEKIGGNLSYYVWVHDTQEEKGYLSAKNINMVKIPNRSFISNKLSDDVATFNNINLYDKGINTSELSNPKNYETWSDFDENWVIKTVDGIPRYPVLKFVDFEYTNIDDISIKHELNKKYNIYDYVTPDTDAAKRIIYKSNGEDIVKIDENGYIIPQKTGKTTIHIESLYDGYIKDVPINIEYQPHYTVYFDANGGTGTMNFVEVEAGEKYNLPENKFIKENYELKEWNTKADGTGISYSNLDTIPEMGDKESITLYAIWWGEERIVTFNAKGGTVTPDHKTVRLYDNYGDLPIPVRNGYGFTGWAVDHGTYFTTQDAFHKLYSDGTELIAKWQDDAYTIIYDANGGSVKSDYKSIYSGDLMSDSLVTTYAKNGQEKELYNNLFEKEGYRFKEWNTKANGKGTPYTEKQIIQLSNVENDTLRLYAIWENESYSVTFDANEGTFADDKTAIVINEWDDSKLQTVEKPTREGYTFKGFFTEKTGGTSIESYIAEAGIDKDGLVFYAQWIPIQYTLKFDANSGEGTMSEQIFTYDVSQKIVKNLYTREGYKFNGWNTKRDGTGTSYIDEASVKNLTSKEETIILYAQWESTFEYIINGYSVDKENKYIDMVGVKTTLTNYSNNIILGPNFTFSIDLGNKDYIFTGSKTKIYKDKTLFIEFTNIIRGDINGDGKISALDYVKVKNHIMKDPEITDKVLLKAADANLDTKVNALDYVRIKNTIMEESK